MSDLMVIMVRMGGWEKVLPAETSPFAERNDESRGVVPRGHDGEGVKRSLTATVNLINVSRDSPLSGSSRLFIYVSLSILRLPCTQQGGLPNRSLITVTITKT